MRSKYFKVTDPFYTPLLPVKTFYNRKFTSWAVIDNGDVIIADNLTRDMAQVIARALNYIDKAFFLLKGLLAAEGTVGYLSSCTFDDQNDRETLVRYQGKLLEELDLKKEKEQNYRRNLWNCFHRLMQVQSDGEEDI